MPASSALQTKINNEWDSLPAEVKVFSGDEIDYEKSLDKANDLTQRNSVIHKYLLDTWGMGNRFPNFDDTYGIVTRICDELGLDANDNPFITFIDLVGDDSNNILTKQNLVNLNNWYADGLLDFNDISGMSSERLKHPIFKLGFYETGDPEFVLKSYNFLDNTTNLKKLNYVQLLSSPKIASGDPLKSLGATYNTKEKAEAITDGNINDIRKAFIYKNATKFRSARDLNQALTLVARERPGSEGSTDSSRIGSDVRRMFGSLSDEDRIAIVSDLISAYGIDLDDLRS